MNVRKAVDYSAMFAALGLVMDADLPQIELYCEIGKIVCARAEKGAAVAAAQNLSKSELLQMIENSAHLESVLDEKGDVWYNVDSDEISERTQYEEYPVYLPRQYTDIL